MSAYSLVMWTSVIWVVIVTVPVNLSISRGIESVESDVGYSEVSMVLNDVCSPLLTWRDMQHIVVETARRANLQADDWVTNGAGLNGLHRCYMAVTTFGSYSTMAYLRIYCRVLRWRNCENLSI